jgi:hypothetical protein
VYLLDERRMPAAVGTALAKAIANTGADGGSGGSASPSIGSERSSE